MSTDERRRLWFSAFLSVEIRVIRGLNQGDCVTRRRAKKGDAVDAGKVTASVSTPAAVDSRTGAAPEGVQEATSEAAVSTT